jgi:hypothetical protein
MHFELHQLSKGAYTVINDDPNLDMELYKLYLKFFDEWQQIELL